MQQEKEWEALFCNDPDHDYALTMEISHGEDIVAIVRCRDGRLMVDFYGATAPASVPLEWLMEKLHLARRDLSKSGTQ
jgi:hypothetical protein